MSVTTPLDEAAWVHSHIGEYSRQQLFDATASLGEWGTFSLRQIASIVGMSHNSVRKLVKPKTARTGGTFSPECLAPLVDITQRRRRGEGVEPSEIREMLAAGTGTSAYMAAKLSGIPETWIRRMSKKGERDG